MILYEKNLHAIKTKALELLENIAILEHAESIQIVLQDKINSGKDTTVSNYDLCNEYTDTTIERRAAILENIDYLTNYKKFLEAKNRDTTTD